MALAERAPGSPRLPRRQTRAAEFFRPAETESNSPLFSVEEELTDERLQKMFTALEEYFQLSDKGNYFEMAAALPTILPADRLPDSFADQRMFNVVLNGFRRCEQTRKELDLTPDIIAASQKMQLMQRFFPQRDRLFHFDQFMYFDEWEEEMREKRQEKSKFFYTQALHYTILAPGKKDSVGADREIFDALRPWVEDFRDVVLLKEKQKPGFFSYDKSDYIHLLAEIVALQPALKDLLSIDDRVFDAGKSELRRFEEKSWWCNFTSLVQDLAILSADRVEFASPGIMNIIPAQQKLSSGPALPVMSEF